MKYTGDSFVLASRTKHHSPQESKQPDVLFVEGIQRQIGHCVASSTQALWETMTLTYLITVKSGLVSLGGWASVVSWICVLEQS